MTDAAADQETPGVLAVPAEARALLRLAGPVAVTQVGQLTMSLVDTWLVGHLGPLQLGAVALGDALLFSFAVVAMGIVQSLDPLVSQAVGARDPDRCAAAWRTGVRLAIALTPLLVAIVFSLRPLLDAYGGMDPEIVRTTFEYLVPRTLGLLPWLLYTTDRCLLNGMGAVRPAMVVTLLANVVNAAVGYCLVLGELGFPALGVAGAGVAGAAARWFMFLALALWLRGRPDFAPYRRAGPVPWRLMFTALSIGLPLGLAQGLEVGAFATASVFMAHLGVVALAAHQVAIKMAATSFMLAVALGTATSIRVGQAIGARNPRQAMRSGWTGLGLGLVCMCGTALLFLAFRHGIVGTFTSDAAVIDLGARLLVVAAAFQLADGCQAIAAGALRGAGDTGWPFVANLAGHWMLALPLAAAFAFRYDFGPVGVWWALAAGLAFVAVVLTLRFSTLENVRPLE